MARILITSGPTREYLDPVRFLTNGSSGRMGVALADEALERGNEVVIVSGPVSVDYPAAAELIRVVSTEEMFAECVKLFPSCRGAIAAAAPCDFRPSKKQPHKLSKNGGSLTVEFVETPDIIAALGQMKQDSQWTVAFALETKNGVANAIAKLQRKRCDWIVLNSPAAIEAEQTEAQLIDRSGKSIARTGSKRELASLIFDCIEQGEDEWNRRKQR